MHHIQLAKKAYFNRRSRWRGVACHEVWIGGKQKIFPEGLTAHEALIYAESAATKELRSDWQKEYEWLRLAEYEAQLAEKCALEALQYLQDGEEQKAALMAQKPEALEERFGSPIVWKNFSNYFPTIQKHSVFYLEKDHSAYPLDGPVPLPPCSSRFLIRALPVGSLTDIQPYAMECLAKTLAEATNQKIDWFYAGDGTIRIFTTGSALFSIHQALQRLSDLIDYFKKHHADPCDFDPLDIETFRQIESCKKQFPGKTFLELTDYFQSVVVHAMDCSFSH